MHSDDSTLLFVKNGAITYVTVEQETDVGHPFVYSWIIAYERGRPSVLAHNIKIEISGTNAETTRLVNLKFQTENIVASRVTVDFLFPRCDVDR